MATPIFQPSFASGEISPTLYSRVDLPLFKTGARLLSNFFVDYRGGFSNRPGSKYILTAKDSDNPVILIPFQYSTLQTYVLEFGHEYMRVITNGAYVLENPVALFAAAQTNPAFLTTSVAHGYSINEVVFITGMGGMTQLNNRFFKLLAVGPSDFTLSDLFGNPINATGFGVYTGGGTVSRVFSLQTPYQGSDLNRLKYNQNQDTMTLTHPLYEQRKLTRSAPNAWALSVILFGTTGFTPDQPSANASVAGTTGYSYKITAVYGSEESIAGARLAIANGPDMSAVAANINLAWNPIATADYYNVYRAGPVRSTVAGNTNIPPEGEIHGFIGTTEGARFTDNNIAQDFSKSPPIRANPFAPGSIVTASIVANGSGYGVTGTTINVTDPTGTGAVILPVIDPVGGGISSVIIVDGGRNYSSPSVTITGSGTGAAISITRTGTTGIFPGVSAFFQQRQVFASTINAPQSFWMTKTGTFSNLDVSNPIQDNDSISGSLISQQVNEIRHMISMPSGLLLLTSYAAWNVSANGQVGGAITPFNISATVQTYSGASYVSPLLIGYDILYVQDKGSLVRDISYNFYYNAYSSVDISLKSNHLLFGHSIVSWAYAEEPFKVIWACREDGRLLSITYVKDQEVVGWAQHVTTGNFRWAASVSEGSENAVYFVVDRIVNGLTFKHIERMASRNFSNDIVNAWFLDAALQYNGAPVTNVANLDHLEGQLVGVLADGVFYQRTVVAKTLDQALPVAASKILVGLQYQCDFQSLPLEQNPTIQDKRIKVSSVVLRVTQTRALSAGTAQGTVAPSKFSTTPDTKSPQGVWANGLFTGDDRINIDPLWQIYGTVWVRQVFPYPVTVTGVLFNTNVGDV